MNKKNRSAIMPKTLREVFGFKSLRPNQAEIIQHVLSGENSLAIMPTDAGKSLCHQLPGLPMKIVCRADFAENEQRGITVKTFIKLCLIHIQSVFVSLSFSFSC